MTHCDFAGWDSEEQFTLVSVKGLTSLRQKGQQLQENPVKSSEIQVKDGKDGDKENGDAQKEAVHSPGLRRQESELDILPGERLPVVVACEAK